MTSPTSTDHATSRRRFLQVAGAAGALPLLAGCDDLPGAVLSWLDGAEPPPFAPPSAGEIDLVRHVLSRVTWGARPGDDERVRSMGVEAFLDQQLHPDAIDDRSARRRIASIESLFEPAGELYEHDSNQLRQDIMRGKLILATHSRRQLFEVMVDFWTDHLNIVTEKDQCRWLKIADDREVVRAHAMGRFRDLIRASAVSPAMLIYLDGHDNKVEQPGDRPNENYARELLELHTLGVHGGYSQRDVVEVARCLSGWTYTHAPVRFRAAHVRFEPARHDNGAKSILGQAVPAGGGADDLERVLDIVCAHPSTARHVATKLCRRFVTEEPDAMTVNGVAEAFTKSDGDIRQTLRALFASDAFQQSRGTLFKRPMRFVVSALRALDAETNAHPALITYLERMGHLPFQYPTPDGYPIERAPWLGTMLWRWNCALAVAHGRVKGTRYDSGTLAKRAGGPVLLWAHLLGRAATDGERSALGQTPDATALALLIAGPAFQVH